MDSKITSPTEIRDLIKAWAAVSVAFGIALAGFSFSFGFLFAVAIAAITVGVGFLCHEMAHKFVAQRYGCVAEFRAFDMLLLLSVVTAFFGFIFAAPGAVMIAGHVTRKENGLISVVGPWTNLVIALVFLGLWQVLPGLGLVWGYGFQINTWLALFNMIPFWIFDGSKVFAWNPWVWGATVAVTVGLMWI
jgi:Zn-dependent protease